MHLVYSQDTTFLNEVIWFYMSMWLILFHNHTEIITDGDNSKCLHSAYHKPGTALLSLSVSLPPATLTVHM